MSFGTEGEGRSRVVWGVAAVVGALAASWYLWPAVGNGSSAVAAFGAADFAASEQPLAREIRDRGRSFEWIDDAATWCDAATMARSTTLDGVEAVVFSIDEYGTCDVDPVHELADLLDDRGVDGFQVVLPGETPSATGVFATIRTVDLLGPDDVLEMPCEWWNDCPLSGTVTVRSAVGALTDEGHGRVARMVAAAIG